MHFLSLFSFVILDQELIWEFVFFDSLVFFAVNFLVDSLISLLDFLLYSVFVNWNLMKVS